jgi:hypothetical protein
MFEAAIAAALLFYLLLLGVPGIEWQFWAGTVLVSGGLLGGGSAGIIYHLLLRNALVRLGVSTRGWLWSPTRRHRALDGAAQRRVLPWFRLGAAGFLVCIAGIGMIVVAVLRSTFSP